jgi:hypothetical protein
MLTLSRANEVKRYGFHQMDYLQETAPEHCDVMGKYKTTLRIGAQNKHNCVSSISHFPASKTQTEWWPKHGQ